MGELIVGNARGAERAEAGINAVDGDLCLGDVDDFLTAGAQALPSDVVDDGLQWAMMQFGQSLDGQLSASDMYRRRVGPRGRFHTRRVAISGDFVASFGVEILGQESEAWASTGKGISIHKSTREEFALYLTLGFEKDRSLDNNLPYYVAAQVCKGKLL